MRVGIVGAGGIGGYLAARLISAGEDVALVARGAHGRAILADGLRLIAPEGESITRPRTVTDDPAVAGPVDILIPAVKAQALAGVIQAAEPMIGPRTAVLTFQNGVDAPRIVSEAVGRERTLMGVARIFANITGPGEITLRDGSRSFTIGDLDGDQSGGAAPVIALLRRAGIEAPDCDDVRVDLWMKFLLFNAVSSTTAGARTNMGVVQSQPRLWVLFEALVREAEAVARAQGVPLPGDAASRILKVGMGLPGAARASTAHDLEEGRPLEIDFICGAVDRLGRETGVPVPASRTVAALLAPWRDGRPG